LTALGILINESVYRFVTQTSGLRYTIDLIQRRRGADVRIQPTTGSSNRVYGYQSRIVGVCDLEGIHARQRYLEQDHGDDACDDV
jgi:hypothetical protein